MLLRLTTRAGIVAMILALIIALGASLAGAQTPPATPETTPTVTVGPPESAPAIRAFEIEISESQDGNGDNAEVKITVSSNNFVLSTDTPDANGNGNETQGLIKYCFDMVTVSPEGSPSPAASPGQLPTITEDRIPAAPGLCILSTDNEITFTQVPRGEHTFIVELVNNDGTSLVPRLYVETKLNVTPTSGGGLFGAAAR